jgi:large subunit ribosomal protein L25
MADALILRAEPRSVHGKKVRRLRREGLVPGVVYGPVVEGTVSVSVERREFERFFNQNGHSTIVTLEWEGGSQPVLVREVQLDPVTRNPLHVDFFAPNMRVVLRANIPVVLHNLGDHEGVLQQLLNEVEVEALPADLPHQVDADASVLNAVGDALHVSDLTVEGNVTIITPAEDMIASLVAEAAEEAAEAAEAEEAEGEEVAEGEEAAEATDAAEGDDSEE